MSSRPSRTIYPSAKLTAENAGQLELSTHRRAVASATALAAPTAPTCGEATVTTSAPAASMPSTTSSPSPHLLDLQPRADKRIISAYRPSNLAPQNPGKRLAHKTSPARASTPTTSVDDINDGMLTTKKAKTVRPSDTVDSLGMHSDVQVMDIDDVADPRTESLNKSDATADIKFFFTLVPSPPGQAKLRMRCNLCA